MTTYIIQHMPPSPTQDTWAFAFSLPYIAETYARTGDGVWFVKSWLTANQIRRRLAILLDDESELHIHTLHRAQPPGDQITWLEGRLDYDDACDPGLFERPRALWGALQSTVQNWPAPSRDRTHIPPAFMVPGSRMKRAA